MTDRELLELAAKAAGIVADYFEEDGDDSEGMWGSGYEAWNPLADDGDALRLAVKCKISFWQEDNYAVAITDSLAPKIREAHNNDSYAATRKAIVRSAAEFWKLINDIDF